MAEASLWPFETSQPQLLRREGFLIVILPALLFLGVALAPLVLPVTLPGPGQRYIPVGFHATLIPSLTPMSARQAMPHYVVVWEAAKYLALAIALATALVCGTRQGNAWRSRMLSEEFRVTLQRPYHALLYHLRDIVRGVFILGLLVAIPWGLAALGLFFLPLFSETLTSPFVEAQAERIIRLDVMCHLIGGGVHRWLLTMAAAMGVYGCLLLSSARLVCWRVVVPVLAFSVAGMILKERFLAFVPLVLYWYCLRHAFRVAQREESAVGELERVYLPGGDVHED